MPSGAPPTALHLRLATAVQGPVRRRAAAVWKPAAPHAVEKRVARSALAVGPRSAPAGGQPASGGRLRSLHFQACYQSAPLRWPLRPCLLAALSSPTSPPGLPPICAFGTANSRPRPHRLALLPAAESSAAKPGPSADRGSPLPGRRLRLRHARNLRPGRLPPQRLPPGPASALLPALAPNASGHNTGA